MSGAGAAARARADAHRAYIARTWGRLSVAEQAAARGITHGQVLKLRMGLQRAGRVSPTTRRCSPRWPPRATEQIRRMRAAGASAANIAATFGRSVEALHTYCRAHKIDMTTRAAWGARELARLFDVDKDVIPTWRDVLQPGLPPHRRWSVSRAQLIAFVAERAYWPQYNPERIGDPEIAAAARYARRMAGGAWLHSAAWAVQHGYAATTARRWCQQGRLEAIKCGRAWYVWVRR